MSSRLLRIHRGITGRLKPTTFVNKRKYSCKASKDDWCDAHMNELPVPCGPWDPWYKARQSTYNTILICGVSWFIFSASLCVYSGSLYLNFFPPERPAPPGDIQDDCAD